MARILVIDDDVGLLQMVKLMLEREGHSPILAEGGEVGIQAAITQRPDVAIIDLMMPGISGYDVTRQLRGNPQTATLPIMILTARSQPMDRQMAFSAGASAFMSKPVSSRDLSARLRELLGGPPTPKTVTETGTLRAIQPNSPTSAPSIPSPQTTPMAAQTGLRRQPIGAELLVDNQPSTQPARLTPPTIKLPEKPLPITAVLALAPSSGGTTTTINLAFLLRRSVERVCVVDFSTTGGQVGLYLRLPMRASWADLLPFGDRFDARVVGTTITPHPQQGIGIVGAAPTPSTPPLSAEAAVMLFTILAAGFHQIVVDISNLTAGTLATLAIARTVLVVVSDEAGGLQANANIVQTLSTLNIDPKKVQIVVNHNQLEAGLPSATIAKILGSPVNWELPYDTNQAQAIRRAIPSVVMSPDSPYAAALQQLILMS